MKPYGAMSSTEYTSWLSAGGTKPRETALVPVDIPVIKAEIPEGKAVTGLGATYLTYSPHLPFFSNTPQQKAYVAARLFWENYLVRMAERPVSGRGGATPWHLEDERDDEVTDESAPNLLAIRDLLERPQQGLPPGMRQPGLNTWRGMTTLTLRHMGLCGTAFWYLDQAEALGGTPLAILYIAPWRLFPVHDKNTGRVIGATLDKPSDDGGMPIDLDNVLAFHLEPPDQGFFATGLVEAFGAKAHLDPLIDRHISMVIGNGGRLTGLLSPKPGSMVTDSQYEQFVRDWRNITNDPTAAQRLQIVQGPVDFVRTAATMDELAIVEIDERTRDAALSLWGVPRSQASIASPSGLNSGSTKGYDEAILWQGAIGPRLDTFRETLQLGLLDRYKALGTSVELVIEQPSFDDEAPAYDLAVKANSAGIPLTIAERRAIVGKDPFGPTFKDDQGRVLDDIVLLPSLVSDAFYANPTQPPPPPEPPQVVVQPPPPPRLLPAGKASIGGKFASLRRTVDTQAIPKLQRAVHRVLSAQREAVVTYLRKAGLEHLRRKVDFRWDSRAAERELTAAMRPEFTRITDRVARKSHALLGKADLDDFTPSVLTRVLNTAGSRIRGINETTEKELREALREALTDADTIDDIIEAVEGLSIWGSDRAEVIARTESMFAYNAAALGSYAELGVTQVQAIDGDEDPECAERDGQVFSIEEAEAIEDHPNGTLDFAPVVPDEPPPAKADPLDGIERLIRELARPTVNVEPYRPPMKTTVHRDEGVWVISEEPVA